MQRMVSDTDPVLITLESFEMFEVSFLCSHVRTTRERKTRSKFESAGLAFMADSILRRRSGEGERTLT